ncbi:MAG: hypothetical protein M1832_000119 [Thelocarpon impressellum]|nr:MAG: hypothetical protein M1832_000119 [Thelocarpon impressellum]
MYFRRFSLALVSTLVVSGAWYAYRDDPASLGDLTSSIVGQKRLQSTSTSPEATEAARRALVVDNDQFYTGTVVGNGPLEKTTDDAGRKVLEMLTPEQVTAKLRTNEESYLVGRGRGVVRYDVVQIPSNDPIEDDHAERIVEVPPTVAKPEDGSASSDWMFWGVFDGHSGWTTSAKLRQVLIGFVARELNETFKATMANPSLTTPSPEAIDAAIKKGFLRLDHEIIHESVETVLNAKSKRVAAELLAPALSGSCALLSFYDSRSGMLRVACTGDSRAVLGRRNGPDGKWTATPLSVDQTGGNEAEAARLRKEHPGEEHVVRNGRILGGLEPSRAFGDSFYKWSRETQERIKDSFFGRTPSALLRTPPYVTAEPVVTTTRVEPGKGDFVVMATDGLWEMLTNEEVVGLVGQWLEAQSSTSSSSAPSWLGAWFHSSTKNTLPIANPAGASPGGDDANGQRAPIRQRQWGLPTSDAHSRFTVQDRNAATHLVRNALGGRDADMVCALLTLPSPYSRRYRDDLTVEVIFFGNSAASGTDGSVVVNTEASASHPHQQQEGEPKAKL